jgi:hypothetical protein
MPDDNDDDYEKFKAELGIKEKTLSQDMKKHNDQMVRKDKEIAIKNKVANKASTSK